MTDDPLDREIDFAGGVRGKFYRPGIEIRIPIYLEENIVNALSDIAQRKGVEVGDLVNDVLKKELAIAEVLR